MEQYRVCIDCYRERHICFCTFDCVYATGYTETRNICCFHDGLHPLPSERKYTQEERRGQFLLSTADQFFLSYSLLRIQLQTQLDSPRGKAGARWEQNVFDYETFGRNLVAKCLRNMKVPGSLVQPRETYRTWRKSIESAKDDVDRSRTGKRQLESLSSCQFERDWHLQLVQWSLVQELPSGMTGRAMKAELRANEKVDLAAFKVSVRTF